MRFRKLLSAVLAAAVTLAALPVIPAGAEAAKLELTDKPVTGSPGWQNQNNAENAFDGKTDTFFDGDTNGWCRVDLGAMYTISQIKYYPRGGKSTDKPSEYVKRMNGGVFSASANGSNWDTLYTVSGLTESNTEAEAVKWYDAEITPSDKLYRYIKYTGSSSANVAEIEIWGEYVSEAGPEVTPEPTPSPTPTPKGFSLIERNGWSAETNSQQDARPNSSIKIDKILDNNPGTFWHSKYDSTDDEDNPVDPVDNPIYIIADTGAKQKISGIRYTPRTKGTAAGDINGVITAYEVYLSDDKSEWTKVGEGNMGYTADGEQEAKDIIFAPAEGQYIKLVVKDNLNNNPAYVASCAELEAYTYTGTDDDHPITAEREKLDAAITKINGVASSHAIKQKLIDKANELKESGSVDGIESFVGSIDHIIDALGWIDKGIDDVYLTRIMDMLANDNLSASAITKANEELAGFYETGNDVKEHYKSIWQDEFAMSEDEYEKPLYERIESAIERAKARIDSGDGKDYIMLKELVSYISGKYDYTGYENQYGRNYGEAEAVVSNINFALFNLDKMDKGELSTELTTFKSGEIWLDTLGSKISAHGGQIIQRGDTYYWYGEDNKVSYTLTTGVSCYSSKDLKNWKYEGLAFKAFDDGTQEKKFTDEFMSDSLLGTQGRIERPKVIYNEKNNNYVMWMHLEKDGGYGLSAMGVAVSDSPTGPFVWQWYGRPVCDSYVISDSKHQFFRDMNLFVDDDKEAYLFASSENNQIMYEVRLNDDYTWIDADDLESSGTTESDITEGKVITPNMTQPEEKTGGYIGSKYTYDKKSFTRYQLAAGGAVSLKKKQDESGADAKDENGNQIYVSTREDGLLCLPEYEDGRWAKVGCNAPEENKAPGKTETTANNSITTQREAPAPIKINGKYYLITSSLSGWKANPSLTQAADSVFGPWTATGNPMTGSGPANNGRWSQNADTGTSFNSQSTCVLKLPNGEYMYMGDRWKNGVYETSTSLGTFPDVDVKASTYVWLPITFETDTTYGDNTLKVRWHDSWSYDAQGGEASSSSMEQTASTSAQVRATDEAWTEMNRSSNQLVEGTNAIEVNGGSHMGAFYSFDAPSLPEGAKVTSVKLTVTRAGNFHGVNYTVLRTGTPSDFTPEDIFSEVSAAVAMGDGAKVGLASDGEGASDSGFGTVTIDVTSAFDAGKANSYFVYLPGAANAQRKLQAGAVMTVEYELKATPTPTATAAPTATPTPTATAAPTVTPAPTATAAPTVTPTPETTPSPSESPEPSKSPSPSESPNPGESPKPSESPKPEVLKAEIVQGENGKINAVYTVPETETRSLTGYFAEYDDGRLIGVQLIPKLETGSSTLSFDCTDGYYYKAFIWDANQAPAVNAAVFVRNG